MILALAAFCIHPVLLFQGFRNFIIQYVLFGNYSAIFSLSIIDLYASMSSSSLRFLMSSTSIALLSIFTITIMYLLPRCERVGNCPVWSENTMVLTFYMLVYMSRTLCPCSFSVLCTLRGVRLGLVDLPFFLDWFRFPFGITLVSG